MASPPFKMYSKWETMIEASNIIAEYLDVSSPADELLAAGQLGQLTLEHMYPEAGEESN
jgi:hypothetical protein